VLGASTVASRFEAQHGAALTPLVGREEEIELLLRRWQRAKSGEGQVVLLSGEPGIGKSRLTRAIQERLAAQPHTPPLYFRPPPPLRGPAGPRRRFGAGRPPRPKPKQA